MTFMFSGAQLAAARQSRGLRREHVAVAVDRSVASVGLYESGRVVPPGDVVAALAAAVGVRPGDLYVEADPS